MLLFFCGVGGGGQGRGSLVGGGARGEGRGGGGVWLEGGGGEGGRGSLERRDSAKYPNSLISSNLSVACCCFPVLQGLIGPIPDFWGLLSFFRIWSMSLK